MTFILSQIPLNELALALGPAFEQACSKALKESQQSPPSPQKEFLTEPEAREFLGSISRSLFHKLKRQDKFTTYHCGEGRCLYSCEELRTYIKNNKPSTL
jgi:hypothetical protein